MASQTTPHVVVPGDYLTAIAYAAGVTVDDIWNDPANAQLKELRSNPEMLAPGDVVYVVPVHGIVA
jgi:LysM repeat protein